MKKILLAALPELARRAGRPTIEALLSRLATVDTSVPVRALAKLVQGLTVELFALEEESDELRP